MYKLCLIKSKLLLLFIVLIMVNSGCSNDNGTTLNSFIDDSSNPYEMLFVSESKAYILRYGSPDIWIVDPSVSSADEEEFKIGEISLRAYDSDNIPEMVSGLIHDNKLFVIMQAMSSEFIPGDAYMAVIDIYTDLEINIDSNPLKGLALNVKNPIDIDLIGNSIYVTGLGRYGDGGSRAPEYTGGIEKINLTDYSSTLLVDDGDDVTHPYGLISSLSLISETQGYFTGYGAWQSVSLFEFNPSTGVVSATPVTGYAGENIQSMGVSPTSELWIGFGDFANPEIQIVDPTDNSLIDSITSLDMNPTQIKFNGTTAAIVGVSSDYSSSKIYLADAISPYNSDLGNAAQDISDIVTAIDENHFYRLGRFGQHNVTQYSLTTPSVVEWQFSTNP
jgi:hypothetical protein